MADELDEGLLGEAAQGGAGGEDVGEGEQRKERPDADQLQRLRDDVPPAKAGHALVPDTGEQLLNVGVGAELKRGK